MENTGSPTALILSRQNIPDLPSGIYSTRLDAAQSASKGAYIVQKDEGQIDMVLIASGSEVATLMEAAELIKQEKELRLQIVSAISEGLFRNQSVAYQKNVLPENIPVIALTAGLPVTMAGFVGQQGLIIGLDHFGYSAPYKVLDEKFGFSGVQIKKVVLDYLKNKSS
jgi:transketolase